MTESEIQTDIMKMLMQHPLVAWTYVTSTGTFKGVKGGRPFNIGIPGLPDICGQTRDGRFLGIEVKTPEGKLSVDQIFFLAMINDNGGIAFKATSADDVMEQLAAEQV